MDSVQRYVLSAAALIVMMVLLSVIKQYLIKKVAYQGRDTQHRNTFIGVIFNLFQYLVILLTIIIILRINGVNVGSLIAGLGIVATLVGLALQDTLKDIISGVAIYTNNFYKVGDVVRYQGTIYEVKYFSARVTKFQNVFTNSSLTVYNSNIREIEKLKEDRFFALSFDPKADVSKIEEAINTAIKRVNTEDGKIHNCGTGGVNGIDDRGVTFYIFFKSDRRDYFCEARAQRYFYEEFAKIGEFPMTKYDRVVKN